MGTKVFRYTGVVMLVWLFILVYMGMNLYQLVDESQKTSMELKKMNAEAEFLRKENNKLRKETMDRSVRALKSEIEKTNNENNEIDNLKSKLQVTTMKLKRMEELVQKMREESEKNELIFENRDYEKSRRRVVNQVTEMWYYVSAQMTFLQKHIGQDYYTYKCDQFLDNFGNLQRITIKDLDIVRDSSGMKEARLKMHLKLMTKVQRKLEKLQNPNNCVEARRLVCNLNKGCGYGCQMHHLLYCFIIAYTTGRTMIIDSAGWRYSHKGWEGFFRPITQTCKDVPIGHVQWGNNYNSDAQIIHLPIVDSLFPRPPQMPLAVPIDLVKEIEKFHGQPFLWWIGQLAAYLFRYNTKTQEELNKRKERMGYKSPIVGVQVRRTDKINLEAAYHGIEEYMYWVELYYKKLNLTRKVEKKRVYLATDDELVLPDARKKYPDYEFVSDNEVSKLAGLGSRYSEKSLYGIIADIHFLSESDYLVCTFSSQVCRLAYEIMNSKHPDASGNFHSLDDIYYFGGQNEHRVRAIYPHEAQNEGEIDLSVGDEIAIAGNHWDGYSKGRSHRLHMEGTFPSYKVEDVPDTAEFPTYDQL